MIPKSAWSVRVCASSDRMAQRCVRRIASSTSRRGELGKTGWSNATAMSGPSAICTPMECSGVNRCVVPSRWLLKVTPPSSITRSSPRLTTWKPPESVRMGLSQPMNVCSPPRRWIRSWPGRRYRWYVLDSMIVAPAAATSSGWSALSVALVPTGMNWGVSTTPWGSVRRPARARVLPSAGGGTVTS